MIDNVCVANGLWWLCHMPVLQWGKQYWMLQLLLQSGTSLRRQYITLAVHWSVTHICLILTQCPLQLL